MDRRALLTGVIASGIVTASKPLNAEEHCSKELAAAEHEKEFFANWLADLLGTMDTEIDRATRVKLIEGCGRGCYRRHAFKQQIAADACRDVDGLVRAYSKSFESWRDEAGDVHVRYGKVSKRCYCPVALSQPPVRDDLLCECTKATHASVFRAALGREVPVEIVETLRRGGKTCHFVARTSSA